MLAEADRLRWVQSFTVSLEHYIFPELVAHPCTLTNMRGLFGDVIADQVMGYVLCFARNLHTYIRQQAQHRYEPLGGESARVSIAERARGRSTRWTARRSSCPRRRWGSSASARSAAQIAGRAQAFGMTVRAVDRHPERVTTCTDVLSVWGVDRLGDLLAASDFVVIAAPQTPETTGLFNAATLAKMKRTGYLINIGRGAIVVLERPRRAPSAPASSPGRRSTSSKSSRCPPITRSGTCPTSSSPRTPPAIPPPSPAGTWRRWSRTSAGSRGGRG